MATVCVPESDALAGEEVKDAGGGIADTAASTNAVVASWVVLVPGAAVGAAGTPVNVGEASGAYVEAAVAMVKYVAAAAAVVR